MSIYKELAICPICGAQTYWTVNNNGDYDPPNNPHEANPNDCQTCKLLKKTNPGMYDLLATLWSKLLDERKKDKEFNNKRETELFDDFDLNLPFRDDPTVWERLAKNFRSKISYYAKISAKNGNKNPKEDSWVWEKSTEEFVRGIIATIKKEKVKP